MDSCVMFCLANLFLEVGTGYVLPQPPVPAWAIEKYGPDAHLRYDANDAANPMGRLSVGYEANVSPRLRLTLEIRHESWIGTKSDKGQNSAWFSMRIMPWRWDRSAHGF